MLGSIFETTRNCNKGFDSFDDDEKHRVTRTTFPFGNGSLHAQEGLMPESTSKICVHQQGSHSDQEASSQLPKSESWFPSSPTSSCSSTPSLSDVDDELIDTSQGSWKNIFGINRAPWDMASDDQADDGERPDQFFFFIPSPVNECSSQPQHLMFQSTVHDTIDDDDEMKKECWIDDDEDTIPAPFEDKVGDVRIEQPSNRQVVVAPEFSQNLTANRQSSRQIQFAFETGLETVHEEEDDDNENLDDSESCFSCCSASSESMPKSVIIDEMRVPDSATTHNVLDTKASIKLDISDTTVLLTREQQAAFDCLNSLAFFIA